jgi:hypothetical protein
MRNAKAQVGRDISRSAVHVGLDELLHRVEIIGQPSEVLAPLHQVRKVCWQLRPHPRGPLDGIGELGRMRRGQRDDRPAE